MEENSNGKELKQIDFAKIAKTLGNKKKLYLYTLPITFVLSCLIILSIPRYYRCEVSLAPEWNNPTGGMSGSLSSLASSFGMNLGTKIGTVDAISPELYPSVFKSTEFKASLFPIRVNSKDRKISNITYYEYLKNRQKTPWWDMGKGVFKKEETSDTFHGDGKINSFWLTKNQNEVIRAIDNKISCKIDKKTNVITIAVEDQDPLICATIADSVKNRLQDFITDYRTKKAQKDLQYTKNLYNKAKEDYTRARQVYSSYADANGDLVLQSYKSKREDLENEMQLKYNLYTMLTGQLQGAYAKLQEQTPAFTTLTNATVPFKPAGPKRMVFVAVMTLLAFFGTSFYILIKE